MKDLLITLLNTAFWFGLHFRYGWRGVRSAEGRANAMVRPKPAFFHGFRLGNAVFRKIGLPKWKDRLPQFNPEFDKRHLKSGRDTAYLDRFLFICRAEVIHYVIRRARLGIARFCLLSADRTAWLIRYAVIALAIQLANLPVRVDSAV